MPKKESMIEIGKILDSQPFELDESKEKKVKKEFAPKVRNAGHFLFVQNENHLLQVASYPDLKTFQNGVGEKAKAIPDNEPIPLWIHFRGRFKPVVIERIRDVKVKL